MNRLQTRYICTECGYQSPKWMGKCPDCDAWDSFAEEVVSRESGRRSSAHGAQTAVVPPGAEGPVPVTSVRPAAQERISSGIAEFDRVLGGGFVPGAVVLVGGDPGIGKSTLLTQVAHWIGAGAAASGRPEEAAALQEDADAARSSERALPQSYLPAIYISGEESAEQIRLRARRLRAETPGLLVSVETEVNAALSLLGPAGVVVVDSIQTMWDSTLDSSPGSVAQVRACAGRLARFAKATGIPVVIIGHVTKEGSLAGPRVLEHIVDTVLYFEGDRHHAYRLLRAVKNRFGSTDELGIFEMRETGLEGVDNPSALLLSQREEQSPGSAVTSTLEGSRAMLVEVQALVARSNLASPRRAVTGLDPGRVNMILAVLEKRMGLKIAEQDVYVNVAGGIRIVEPAGDLAVAAAVASSFREQVVDPRTILLGEVGLAGEIR
ncbi:MAG TPA: DNA repair protein RadA, partial [Chthonomonadales bacterium]|nr:DNA repair protein RadA [Chthonomonadales bacterium]